MQNNTVQTLIDYIIDLTGQDNLGVAKAIRAINFAVDHYTYLAITSSGRWRFDSSNHNDMSRVTATLPAGQEKLALEGELISLNLVELLVDGRYVPLTAVDTRDFKGQSLSTVFTGTGVPINYDYDSHFLYVYPQSDTARTVRVTYSRAHPRFTTADLASSIGVIPIHEEYIALYAADRVMIGSKDSSRADIRDEMKVKEDEIRDLFSKRDEDTPRQLIGKVPSVFMRSARPRKR